MLIPPRWGAKMQTALWCIGIYLAIGIVIRFMMYAGPEDDGGLWAVLLWPLIIVIFISIWGG